MAADNIVGNPMQTVPPAAVGGKMTDSYLNQDRAWKAEVSERLQNGISSFPSLTVGEADVRHGPRKLMLPAVMFQSRIPDYVTLANLPQPEAFEGARFINSAGVPPAGSPVWCPIPLTEGDRIIEVDLYVDGNVSAAPALKVWKLLMTAATGTAATQIGATVNGTATATIQTLARTGLTESIVDATEYWLSCALGGGTEAVRGARIIYDRP